MSPLCEFLEWDSDLFGFRIARVCRRKLTIELLREVDNWCIEHKIRCLYFLAPLDHGETIWLVEEDGFRLMDVRTTFELSFSDIYKPSINRNSKTLIRDVISEDIDHLRNISREIFHSTRFYFDTNFPKKKVHAMYETWLEKSCKGFADSVFVAAIEDIPIGYITCHIDENTNSGRVGLIGVGHEYQGKGIGKQLIQHALEWYSMCDVKKVTIITQGRNIAAQKLFERCGFRTRDAQLWFHKWFPDKKK